ncbi:MAG: GntR family transcriptional regulator [Clostridia bacterium]
METDDQSILIKKVLSERIKEQLIEDLLNKKYKSGDKLVESTLAKRFGVSQAPVREALKALVEMGFVTIEPYKGTTVRTMTKAEMWETFTVRAALESLAAGIAAEKITPDEITKLEGLVDEMIKAAEEGDLIKRTDINNQFHEEIIRISGHKLIMRLSRSMRFANWSHTTGTFTSMSSVEIASRHKEIIRIFKKHNSEEAAAVMREHIEHTASTMLENWEDEE